MSYDDFLRDVRVTELSASTRLRCAFDALYEVFKQVVDLEAIRARTDGPRQFAYAVVDAALCELRMSDADVARARALCAWVIDIAPLPPLPLELDDAIALCERAHAGAIAQGFTLC